MSMVRICAWCRIVMGIVECAEDGETHGICSECAERELGKVQPEAQR